MAKRAGRREESARLTREVGEALLQNALGYAYTEEVVANRKEPVVENGKKVGEIVTPVVQQVRRWRPHLLGAQTYWLANSPLSAWRQGAAGDGAGAGGGALLPPMVWMPAGDGGGGRGPRQMAAGCAGGGVREGAAHGQGLRQDAGGQGSRQMAAGCRDDGGMMAGGSSLDKDFSGGTANSAKFAFSGAESAVVGPGGGLLEQAGRARGAGDSIVFWANPRYLPFVWEETRTQIFYGSASSGKSTFLAQRAVFDLLRGRNYLVCRAVARTLAHSVFAQVVKVVELAGLGGLFEVNKGEMALTCKANGAQMLFAGLDDVDKLKSLTPARGALTDIWLEEATEAKEADYRQLTKRLRGVQPVPGAPGAVFPKRIALSFNPVHRGNWVYRAFFQGVDDRGGSFSDVERGLTVLKTTFRDNLFLAPDDCAALEAESDRYFYQVYTLGNWGELGRAVFTNVEVRDIGGLIPTFDKIYNGLDFGFSADPNALVRVHLDQGARELYVFEEVYRPGMHDDELADLLLEKLGGQPVVCDSSQPKSIDHLRRRGVRALPAVKGADSVGYGIRFLQGYKIIVHTGCVHTQYELGACQWAVDRSGNPLGRPVDRDNHLIDALRYALEEVMLASRGRGARRI